MKGPLLKDKSDEPTADDFRLPSWWPGSTGRGSTLSTAVTFTATALIGAAILLASGQWLWGVFLVAVGVVLAMGYRQVAAAERLLDEAERKLALEEPAADDREEREQYLESLSMLDADGDPNR